MEYVEGVCISDLNKDQKEVVIREIEIHLLILYNLKSNKISGPSGIIIPPYRIIEKIEDEM